MAHKGAGVWRNKPTACQRAKKPQCPGKRFHQVLLIKDDLRPSGTLTKAEACLCAYGMSVYSCARRGVIITHPDERKVRRQPGKNTSAPE